MKLKLTLKLKLLYADLKSSLKRFLKFSNVYISSLAKRHQKFST